MTAFDVFKKSYRRGRKQPKRPVRVVTRTGQKEVSAFIIWERQLAAGSEYMAKENKLEKLAEILKATDTKAEFNIVEDLEELLRMFGVLKAKDYRKKLTALIEKYKSTEITVIREALLDRCQKGDVNAIRLYCDYFKSADSGSAEDDGLLSALQASGKEVFENED